MHTEKITLRAENGQQIEVVIYNKRADAIDVIIGEGVHSVKCRLTPARNGRAYVGTVMGREVIYDRTPEQVKADIERLMPSNMRKPRRR